MYPTVVIVIVETQRSITDICEISPSDASRLARPVTPEDRPATIRHPSFVVGTTNSDNDAESQHSRALQSHEGQVHDLEDILEVKESQVGTNIAQ